MENTGKFDVPTTCFGRTVAGSIPDGVIEPPHYGAVVDSAPNRNEYHVYFLGGKGGRCMGLTLPPPCANCPEILGASTFLEP